MTVDLFGIGTSALRAFQRSLSVTGNNIANVNTPGYSRQQALLDTPTPFNTGRGFLGRGVEPSTVRRIYDRFVSDQVRINRAAFSQQETFYGYSSRLDSLLDNAGTSLAPGMQNFFDATQDVATSPNDLAARQVMLSDAQSMVDRFHLLAQDALEAGKRIDNQLRVDVNEINSLTTEIANVNGDIRDALATGHEPNDLLDHRDKLLDDLSQKVSINTIEQDDGTFNVFIGNGQGIVVGSDVFSLDVVTGSPDPAQKEIVLLAPGGNIDISQSISGGSLGGALEYRNTTLKNTQNELGRIAVGLGMRFNQQQAVGLDLNGNLGGNFFNLASPQVIDSPTNSTFGISSVNVQFEDPNQLTAHDYQLSFDGVNWNLLDVNTGNPVALTASGGDLLADGLRITPDPGAVAGDQYEIRPTRLAAGQIELALTGSDQIAAARTHLTAANSNNAGDAGISPVEVLDSANAAFFTDLNLVFDNPPTTFTINGGASQAFVTGADIDVNGVRFQITGSPVAGDTFTISNNQGATGDGANALAMAQSALDETMGNGTLSFGEAYSEIIAGVGTRTRQAGITMDSQQVLLDQSIAQQQSVSGVNLDEEAANLQKFQQSYQAAAQVIAVADDVFNTLLSAVRR
ncbi:MAG: flagellar hook-associated protein FlgK [bacterium]